MSSRRWGWGLALALLVAVPAAAQIPGGGVGPVTGMIGPPGPSTAEFLLANTGELHLTDQQVTRLAAIARRAESQRQALRATMDSMAAGRRVRGDSARPRAGAGMLGALPAAFAHMREQSHTDLREALSVLTPEQLATAWEKMASRSAGMGGPMRAVGFGRMMRPFDMGPGRGRIVRPPMPPGPPVPPGVPPAPPQPPS